MIYACIDYPTSHVTIHRDPDCRYVEESAWARRRKVRLDANTFSTEIKRLAQGAYRLGSGSGGDTLWLEIQFGDQEFELATALFVKKLLGRRYKPIREARVTVCCPRELRGELSPR
jgi:hypothetical protein